MPDGDRAVGLFARFCLCTFLVSFTLSASAQSSAQLPRPIAIEWTGSPLCPRSAALELEIARLLGRAPSATSATTFEVRVDELVERTTNYYRLTLRVRSAGDDAERSVELATCGDVQDAAALLIASAVDPHAALRVAPPVERADAPPAPAAESEPIAKGEVSLPIVARRWSLRATALLDVFSVPKPTLGLALGGLWQHQRYRAWVDARYLVARRTQTRDAQADVDVLTAALGGSYVWWWRSLVLGPAAELELGMLRADASARTQAVSASNGSTAWSSVQLGAVAAYAVHRRVGVEAALFAGLPLRHPALRDGMGEPFYTTSAVTMRLALGLRVSLGSN